MDRFEVEFRAKVDGNRLTGHASVFGQETRVPGNYEMIQRGAFDKVLEDSGTDVRALINHDPNLLLGRQSSGTLRLNVDKRGLEFEVDLPDTSYAQDLRELAKRGDLSGASFGFIPNEDRWEKRSDGTRLRTHTSVGALIDVSVVTFPAYEGASAQVRSDERPDFAKLNRKKLVRARANVHLR